MVFYFFGNMSKPLPDASEPLESAAGSGLLFICTTNEKACVFDVSEQPRQRHGMVYSDLLNKRKT